MANSFVPQRKGEDLDAYLARVHQMVQQLSSGDYLMVRDGEAVFAMYHSSLHPNKTPAVLAHAKQVLAERNTSAFTLPHLIFTASCSDGWSASIDAAAERAKRLNYKVFYRYGSLEVIVYPWDCGFTEELKTRIYKLAKAAGLTMKCD